MDFPIVILMIGLAFRGRVLPLVWKVQKKPGPFQLRYVESALRFIARWAPRGATFWVVGDREFQDVSLQTFVRDALGWHFVQRSDQNLWVFSRGRCAFKLCTSGLRGEFHSFGRVQITRQRFGWVELIGDWRADEDEPRYLISALAYVWLINIGVAVVKQGLRHRVDRRARRP